ncbi:MAG: bifunctional DNA-formamidopyrimidine glycosylase/DNA-(apurinic or apyrimidinic site) lyase [Syntrophothermus sp.]|uniref:bifunctional DNA-formamidopyrimidine glycosylase/DNA-(apurinic or apyrimidinic site) lyase n=1 Tax=Syntrophothermus sp. TaxID=2736299 RepID=UPI00257AB9AC|nr:bifunctional DNA-formamidopyrimidine glycosylase/DNA-(apurinic or apyrimidinic site) lyase [Syntrophothermus sp.]NSW83554.1 bifunctional DNA-formamidopyrimidine glycosylase/DNA-(apurinic or apyrimidinic site) lyase [Syntrophothermus sp.]
MPELPEVETIKRSLGPIVGKTVTGLMVLRSDIVKRCDFGVENAVGSEIIDVTRRGKYLVIKLSCARHLVVHLGMTGRLLMVASSEPIADHTHMVINLEGEKDVRYQDPRRFGNISFVKDTGGFFSSLGPEPLDPSFGPEELARRLKRRSASIKPVLLDQGVVAGIGNIYADEILFAAGLHPARGASELNEYEISRLHAAIKEVITRAIEWRGTTFRDYRDGFNQPGQFQTHLAVYGRYGQPCPKCGQPVQKTVIGGRTTHYCAICQE